MVEQPAVPGVQQVPEEQPESAPVATLPVPLHAPLWTYVFLAINVLIWLAMTLAGGSQDVRVLVRFGAKFQPLIVQGEYWRLLTASFIHIGLLHLLMNAYALSIFGVQVEGRFGRLRFFLLYLLSGLAGTALSYVGTSALSAGASAAIFGLIGAITAYYAIYRDAFGTQGRRQLSGLLIVMGYNLVWGLLNPQIDNLGHVGGLVAGLALGWGYCPRYALELHPGGELRLQDRFSRSRAAFVTLAVGVAVVGLTALGTWLHSGNGI